MDNASFHRKNCLNNIAQKYGIKIIFLPPYSPELNPIEHFWHWLKKKIVDLIPANKAVKILFLFHISLLYQ